MTKPWYQSRTKVGAVFAGGSFILAGIGNILLEKGSLYESFTLILLGVGMIYAGVGLRDAIEKK